MSIQTRTDPLDAADDLIDQTRTTGTEPGSDPQLEALALAVLANLPVLLWGEPGIGKSSALAALSGALRVPLETVIASVHDPSDFAGLPMIGADSAENGVTMAPPDWAVRLARRGDGLLFLDELSSAPPAVQAALLRVVLERQVGSLPLPPRVRVVAAANPASSAADGWQLSAPLANRFVHLQWTHQPATVARGLSGVWPEIPVPLVDPDRVADAVATARATVTEFLTVRPGLAHQMPKNTAQRGGAWPSPRTWEMAVRLLAVALAAGASRDARLAVLAGTVGDGVALELLAHADARDLPDPEDLLADPGTGTLPTRGDRQLAVLSAVVAAVRRRPDRVRWNAGWAVLAWVARAGAPDVAASAA
ncbi:MAG: AAA family ATPase, partial [Actinocatenispora sp.]